MYSDFLLAFLNKTQEIEETFTHIKIKKYTLQAIEASALFQKPDIDFQTFYP